MAGEHRPKRDLESQTTLACRADLARGEIGVGAVLSPDPLTEIPADRSLRRESIGMTT